MVTVIIVPMQIQKLLTMYQPLDDQRVPVDVIRYVARQGGVATGADPAHLMLDIGYRYPISFPFSITDVNFATIDLPIIADYLVKI